MPELTQSPPPSLQCSLKSSIPGGELASRTVVLKGEGSISMSLLARAFRNGVPGAPPGPLGFKRLGVRRRAPAGIFFKDSRLFCFKKVLSV